MSKIPNWAVAMTTKGTTKEVTLSSRRDDGWMHLAVKQRDKGEQKNVLEVACLENNGVLTLIVRDEEGKELFKHTTER